MIVIALNFQEPVDTCIKLRPMKTNHSFIESFFRMSAADLDIDCQHY